MSTSSGPYSASTSNDPMALQKFAGEFLTFLEQREERLLSWGFYNIRQSAQDIEDFSGQVINVYDYLKTLAIPK